MAKLTLHQKVAEGYRAAVTLRNYANRLKFDSKDYDFETGVSLAEEMKRDAEEFIKILK